MGASATARRLLGRALFGVTSRARLAVLSAAGAHGARIARAVALSRAAPDPQTAAWERRIELERARLLACDLPLAAPGDGRVPHDLALSVADACRASKSRSGAVLLHQLVRVFEPKLALELGTNVGLSAAYQAAALGLAGAGRLLTIEASPARVAVARGVHRELGLSNVEFVTGSFEDELPAALARLGSVDYVFVDGNHHCAPTLAYFDAIARAAADGAIVVLDDIRWSGEMRRVWRAIRRDSRVVLAVDLWEVGVCVLGAGRSGSASSD